MRDRFIGALVGCAVGDALGAPFEGLWSRAIPSRDELVSDFAVFEGYPSGQYTDDTQLTIATVESIVETGDLCPDDVARRIASLWEHRRIIGPGGACTHAAEAYLRTRNWATCGAPRGQAGNGTAMRTAILGLWFLGDAAALSREVAKICRITHQDERSVAGGVAVAEAARRLASEERLDAGEFCSSIADTIVPFHAEFASHVRGLPSFLDREDREAREAIAWAGQTRPEFDEPIITPFVIPTVLASLWSLLRHPDSWGDAVAEGIHWGGDVDTIGAIIGALCGTRLGGSGIPEKLARGVVEGEYLRALATRYWAAVGRP